jgi:hypothetical protein
MTPDEFCGTPDASEVREMVDVTLWLIFPVGGFG